MTAPHDKDLREGLSVTNTRVDALADAVRGLQRGQEQLATDFTASLGRVSTELAAEIKSVATSLQERSKIPWQALGVMLAFLTTIGTLVYLPIQQTQTRMETLIGKMDDSKVTKSELASYLTNAGQRRDDAQRAGEERDRETRAQIEKMRGEIVSRGEHAEKWAGTQQRFADQQRQIDQISTNLAGIYTPRDAFGTLGRRLDDVERALRELKR